MLYNISEQVYMQYLWGVWHSHLLSIFHRVSLLESGTAVDYDALPGNEI